MSFVGKSYIDLQEASRIFGFDDPQEDSYRKARNRIHPEDLSTFDENLERVLREKTDFETNFRLLLPDGSIKHVHCVSRPVFNASGEVVELVAPTWTSRSSIKQEQLWKEPSTKSSN